MAMRPAPPALPNPADTLKRQGSIACIPPTPPPVRVASTAANRARVISQAYVTLGVTRNISDEHLNRVYATLIQKEHPDSNPPELAAYYAKKQKEIRAAYAAVVSNRRLSAQLSATAKDAQLIDPFPASNARASAQLWLKEVEGEMRVADRQF